MARSADIIRLWNQLCAEQPRVPTPTITREVAQTLGVTPTQVLNVIAGPEGAAGCIAPETIATDGQ